MSQNDQLQQLVLAELRWEPSVTAAHIGVTAEDGVITLSGAEDIYAGIEWPADSAEEAKQVIDFLAKRTMGVKQYSFY